MKKACLILVSLMLATGPFASAETVTLTGAAADSFITRHFPNADIPGSVEGVFHYVNRHGEVRQGYAECFVPAMGGRSDGVVSTCTVQY